MSAEFESIPISALQHFAFCPRQCALIHIERAWEENILTAQGRVLHDRAHDAGAESRRDVRVARALPLQSERHGLHGVADVVEFHLQADGSWEPFPVEYKRGRPKFSSIDAVQLCAQALCLEEMLNVSIASGALFYGETRRRQDVAFDVGLRAETARIAEEVRAMLSSGRTPPPVYAKRCDACSLLELCQPRAIVRRASDYLTRLLSADD